MEVINSLLSNDIGYLNALRQAPSMPQPVVPPPVTIAPAMPPPAILGAAMPPPAILAPAIAPVAPKLAIVQKSTLSPWVWVFGGIAIGLVGVVVYNIYQDSKKEEQ